MDLPNITKSDGTQEQFAPDKLRRSLKKAGATESDIEQIVEHIVGEVKEGTSTDYIYRHAFELLKQAENGVAARYSLRRALADLGPSGYPFEQFVGEIYRAQGYEIEIGKELQGKCVSHEVDLVARKEGEMLIGEAKFHRGSHMKSDVKVALYVSARFEDLKRNNFENISPDGGEVSGLLITNTKFTSHAVRYGMCAGLKLVGWGHPEEGNLQQMIEGAMLQPVTTLTTLNGSEKRLLLENEVVLCRTVRDNPEVLSEVGIDASKHTKVIDEVKAVCHL